MLRSYRDRDYVSTWEGFCFCVVGGIHPPDRVIAYLKYVPDPAGNWGKGKKRFKRALTDYTTPSLVNTFTYLKAFPQYLYCSPFLNVQMSAVPLNCILNHFKPEVKLHQLYTSDKLDLIQAKTVELVERLSEESSVSVDYFGITGSVLLDIHQDFSDIDLLIYGMKNASAVKKGLLQHYEKPDSSIRRFDEKTVEEWCIEKSGRYPLTYAEAANIFHRKWGRGVFSDTKFSVHPIKVEEENLWMYEERVYQPKGLVKAEAIVSDDSETSFLPAIYKVEDVKVLEGVGVDDIHEVASYDGFYCDVAFNEEKIRVKGKLENVKDKKREKKYHRIVVGSSEAKGQDYIKVVSEK